MMLVRVAGVTPEGLTEECLMKGSFPEGQVVLVEPKTDGSAPRDQLPRVAAPTLGTEEQREKVTAAW